MLPFVVASLVCVSSLRGLCQTVSACGHFSLALWIQVKLACLNVIMIKKLLEIF